MDGLNWGVLAASGNVMQWSPGRRGTGAAVAVGTHGGDGRDGQDRQSCPPALRIHAGIDQFPGAHALQKARQRRPAAPPLQLSESDVFSCVMPEAAEIWSAHQFNSLFGAPNTRKVTENVLRKETITTPS